MIPRLTATEFARYKKLKQRKYRHVWTQFIAEGHHLVQEAHQAHLIELIITSDPIYKLDSIPIKLCTPLQMQMLSSVQTPQTVLAICKFIPAKATKLGSRILVLNQISDPGNLGTLIRSARAFGFNDVVVQGVDVYNSKVLRASQGALFGINVFNCPDLPRYLESLRLTGYQLVAALVDSDAHNYQRIVNPSKLALILGNEARGIEPQLHQYFHHKVYIPIRFESLNVSAAGAVLMAHYAPPLEAKSAGVKSG